MSRYIYQVLKHFHFLNITLEFPSLAASLPPRQSWLDLTLVEESSEISNFCCKTGIAKNLKIYLVHFNIVPRSSYSCGLKLYYVMDSEML